jgi:hypothetical protein
MWMPIYFKDNNEIPSRMKIYPATVEEQDGIITVRYRFDTPSQPQRSGELWFRIDSRYRDFLHTGPAPAVAALAMSAMSLGEDIEVSQPLSPRFHYGLLQFSAHFHLWLPGELLAIRVRPPSFSPMVQPDARAVVSCFSGGVDSFYTLYEHLGAAAPNADFKLSHLFYAHGFDVPLGDPLYDELAAEFAELAKGWNLGFIGLSTNVRSILDPLIPWVNSHGACLAASALLLAGGTRTFIIPSTNRHSTLFAPCGSNPVTDPMFGTESLDIVHHGSHQSRIQKILAIEHRSEARNHLHVCWQNIPGPRNCGRCIKCLKTMLPLKVTGSLDQFPVFPPLPPWKEIESKCFAPLDLSRYAQEETYADELRALALHRGSEALPHL